MRNICSTCGHGYGVHSRLRTPLLVRDGKVEFFDSPEDARDICTGYPDQMERDGRRCGCCRFMSSETQSTLLGGA